MRELIKINIANKNIARLFEINGIEVYLTESLVATWAVMGFLIVFAVIVRIKLKNFKDVPSGFQNVIETAVEALVNFTKNTLGEKLKFMDGYFFTVFVFILAANYSGLTGFLRPPTSDLATTAALAITTFIIIHIVGIVCQRGAYFKAYLSPFFLFLPMNIMGELAKPMSLAFRLFGNVLGGLLIMELFYGMTPLFVQFAIPSALHVYFDLFSGALQAFVFTILSMTFIQLNSVAD
ncbi:MAG: F0F1 ATP synthase subunit A [Oscillospiraceae bacterium]|nr:F0F1 ATP synthase subunit A [Oscillospiraceae bacterium]